MHGHRKMVSCKVSSDPIGASTGLQGTAAACRAPTYSQQPSTNVRPNPNKLPDAAPSVFVCGASCHRQACQDVQRISERSWVSRMTKKYGAQRTIHPRPLQLATQMKNSEEGPSRKGKSARLRSGPPLPSLPYCIRCRSALQHLLQGGFHAKGRAVLGAVLQAPGEEASHAVGAQPAVHIIHIGRLQIRRGEGSGWMLCSHAP